VRLLTTLTLSLSASIRLGKIFPGANTLAYFARASAKHVSHLTLLTPSLSTSIRLDKIFPGQNTLAYFARVNNENNIKPQLFSANKKRG